MRLPSSVPRIVRLVAGAVGLLIVVSILLFTAVSVLPGDAVSQALGPGNTPAKAAQLRAQLGLDASAPVQYWRWVTGLLHGDLGRSAVSRVPIGPVVADRAGHSLILAGVALVTIAIVGVGAGFAAGARPGSRTDRIVSTVTLTVTAVPEFALATVLVAVFAVGLAWLPAVSLVAAGTSVFEQPDILVLPTCSLTLYGGAYVARMIRAVVADVSAGPSVEAARIAGLPELHVLRRHVLPVVAGPITQVLALLVPYLVGGALVVETVFAYPGLGALLSSAIGQRDAIEVADCGMILATVAVTGFLAAELVHLRRAVPGRPDLADPVAALPESVTNKVSR